MDTNQVIQGQSSGASTLPLKRKRGRPRKDKSLKHVEAAQRPPGFEGVKENRSQKVNNTNENYSIVGQPVTGVVEAAFDAGYLLTVRIGNSNSNLRGVVFKPGRYVPITVENDIAPHVPMIRRHEVHFPAGNQTRRRGRKPKISMAISRVNHASSAAPSVPPSVPPVPPVGVRGTVVPVVLQPVNPANGMPPFKQMPQDASLADQAFGDKEVHTVEPLAMLPPAGSIPTSQILMATSQMMPSHPQSYKQVAEGSMPSENISPDEGTPEAGQQEKDKMVTSSELLTPGSSQSLSSETHTESDKEAGKSSAEDSGDSKPETGGIDMPFLSHPLNTYGTGTMTELLQAVQVNKQLPITEPPPSTSGVEPHEVKSPETDQNNEASIQPTGNLAAPESENEGAKTDL